MIILTGCIQMDSAIHFDCNVLGMGWSLSCFGWACWGGGNKLILCLCLMSSLCSPASYPRIIGMLSTEERGLFRERIRYLDRKIHPGLKKLHWSYKGASAAFITECRLHASKVRLLSAVGWDSVVDFILCGRSTRLCLQAASPGRTEKGLFLSETLESCNQSE